MLGCGVGHCTREREGGTHEDPRDRPTCLMMLRGSINVRARMKIAAFLGVRVGVELKRLRAASHVLAQVLGV